ncbi:MAG: hypothetical protein M1814_006634 [Vezdaea aestivalis]|nr:MAG: hypothetical protein M1814_006634 [Vezdaea aestivalis]
MAFWSSGDAGNDISLSKLTNDLSITDRLEALPLKGEVIQVDQDLIERGRRLHQEGTQEAELAKNNAGKLAAWSQYHSEQPKEHRDLDAERLESMNDGQSHRQELQYNQETRLLEMRNSSRQKIHFQGSTRGSQRGRNGNGLLQNIQDPLATSRIGQRAGKPMSNGRPRSASGNQTQRIARASRGGRNLAFTSLNNHQFSEASRGDHRGGRLGRNSRRLRAGRADGNGTPTRKLGTIYEGVGSRKEPRKENEQVAPPSNVAARGMRNQRHLSNNASLQLQIDDIDAFVQFMNVRPASQASSVTILGPSHSDEASAFGRNQKPAPATNLAQSTATASGLGAPSKKVDNLDLLGISASSSPSQKPTIETFDVRHAHAAHLASPPSNAPRFPNIKPLEVDDFSEVIKSVVAAHKELVPRDDLMDILEKTPDLTKESLDFLAMLGSLPMQKSAK